MTEIEGPIGEEQAEALKEQIANKLAVGAIVAGEEDWWWTAPSPTAERLLQNVHRVLERATPRKGVWRRRLGYAWVVVEEFIYLGIVVGVFSVAATKFETATFAVLVLIYNRTREMGSGGATIYQSLWAGLSQIYGAIGRRLKLKISVRSEIDALRDQKQLAIKVAIYLISTSLGTLIALWHLLGTILF